MIDFYSQSSAVLLRASGNQDFLTAAVSPDLWDPQTVPDCSLCGWKPCCPVVDRFIRRYDISMRACTGILGQEYSECQMPEH